MVYHGVLTEEQGAEFLTVWRACDIDHTCRSVLKSHPPSSHARHTMVDIMARLGPFNHGKTDRLLETHRANFVRDMEAGADSKSNLVMKHGRAYATKLWNYIKTISVLTQTFCVCCFAQCPLHPPPAVRRDKRYMTVLGNTCIPWSMMGSKFGWLHECTLVFMAWLRDVLEALPEHCLKSL